MSNLRRKGIALKSYILDKRCFSCKFVCRSIHPHGEGRRLDQELDWRENGVHGWIDPPLKRSGQSSDAKAVSGLTSVYGASDRIN